MKQYIEVGAGRDSNKILLIKKESICWVEEWIDDSETPRAAIHIIFENRSISVPVDQVQRVLKEIKEYWSQ